MMIDKSISQFQFIFSFDSYPGATHDQHSFYNHFAFISDFIFKKETICSIKQNLEEKNMSMINVNGDDDSSPPLELSLRHFPYFARHYKILNEKLLIVFKASIN